MQLKSYKVIQLITENNKAELKTKPFVELV